MRKLLLIPSLFFVSIIQSQDIIKEYVKKNTSQIFSIDPDSTDYDDLKNFGDAIGEARIVLLGEQEHGDAGTFLAKSRLIKYLHEKKGFNVLAFESDFFGLTEGWDNLQKTKEAIDSFMYKNPFPIWSRCNTISNLFYNYLAVTNKTSTPLNIAGFDSQLHGNYTETKYITRLTEILNKIELVHPIYKADIRLTLKNADSIILKYGNVRNKDTLSTNKSIQFLENLLSNDVTKIFSSFEIQVIRSLIAELNSSKIVNGSGIVKHYFRDKQMAENIEWLFQTKYPNEKIIVWAHNAHIAKNYGSSKWQLNENSMMGHYLSKSPILKDKIYVVGFTSFNGYTQWATVSKFQHKIQNPPKNGFENWMPKNYQYAFTDFNAFNLKYAYPKVNFSMKGSIYDYKQHGNFVTDWTKAFDGVFFIREMYGCKVISGNK